MAHINSVVSQAHTQSNLILECFVSRDRTTLVKAFTTYVRPLVDYASPVWSAGTLTAIDKINVKKNVVYHLVNGSTVLLRIENSKNDRLKVILLVAV